ncbi:exosortase/archaeosortase family protein (plasmid) [Singulisphaera sp. Ch08]|uniref:Exosortase/archaeosortase family protein n=1 Tax=Singulisphaera sp. Ch08 TaxID=3120278 RepID=A0AAU7CTJ7_9BACT
MATVPSKASESWRPGVVDILSAVFVAIALGWSYAPSLASLASRWSRDPNYSFGFLVIPIALAIAWGRRDQLDRARLKPKWWGFLPLLALLGARVLLYEWNEQYLETATIPLVVAALLLALGGWQLVRVFLPAVVFLFFMLPLPPSINTILANPLQRLATIGSVAVLQVMGLPVLADGNVITVGAEPLEVAQACNGLSMLLSFVTLITAMVILIPRPLWERVVLLVSAIPIALVTNIIRIVVTAWCYHHFGHETGEKISHDAAGLAMPVIALVLAFAELWVLSWLMVEVEDQASPGARPRSSGRPHPEPN